MHAILLSFDRRGLRRSSLVLGAVLLAACDNDRPVGPNPTAVPTVAALGMGPTKGVIQITIADKNKQPLTTAGAEFALTLAGQPSITAIDNGAGDSDPAAGRVFVKGLKPGVYDVCEKAPPTDYVLPSPNCQTATAVAGGITPVDFINLTVPRASWVAFDQINFDTIPGITVTGDDGSGPVVIIDNSPLDLDPAPGKFEVRVPNGTSYSVCPKATPPGYAFPNIPQGCLNGSVTPGETTALGNIQVRHEYSAYWFVTLGGSVADGAEFSVTNASTGTTFTVKDDGPNDMAAGMGMVYIKLFAPGWYTICETVPPLGGQLADPVCKRVEIVKGEYGFAIFDSKPI